MFIKYIATCHFPEIILKITIKVDKTVDGKYSFTNCQENYYQTLILLQKIKATIILQRR